MSFLRRALRSVLVIVIVSLVLGALFSWRMKPRLPKHFVVEVTLAGPLRETVGGGSFAIWGPERLSLVEMCEGLRDAGRDPRVKAVLLRISSVQTGWAAANEIRRALGEARRGGRPVVALLEAGGDKEYAVATAADSVFLIPAGYLLVDGLAAQIGFWKGTMEKVGLEAQIERIGDYKSAPEVYTRSGMSREFRESIDGLLDDVFGAYVDTLASARRLTAEQIRDRIDSGPFGAAEAVSTGLVDGLRYRADILEAFGVESDEVVSLDRYVAARPARKGTKLAFVVVEGGIMPGRSTDVPFAEPTAGSETVSEALREAREDETLKGVILRVNSPGGSAMAADVIWDEVRRTAAVKPVVVSMGDAAASGGYYVAMAATTIIAEAATTTGSIGVYAGKLVASELYEKVDYRVEALTRGVHADLFSEARPFTDEERKLLHGMLWDFYWNAFLAKAAQGRRMAPEQVDRHGRGRVWSGIDAQAAGLVDALGGIWQAQAQMADLLELPADAPMRLVPIPRPKPLLARVAEFLLSAEGIGPVLSSAAHLADLSTERGLSLRMPHRVTIE